MLNSPKNIAIFIYYNIVYTKLKPRAVHPKKRNLTVLALALHEKY